MPKKYEYRVTFVDYPYYTEQPDLIIVDFLAGSLNDEMTNMGNNGWQLISIQHMSKVTIMNYLSVSEEQKRVFDMSVQEPCPTVGRIYLFWQKQI